MTGQFSGQQGNYGGPAAQSPASYGGQGPLGGYTGPPSAGGYGRGGGQQQQQQQGNSQWTQPAAAQNFNNGSFSGYQG